jgi:hypothetical protein
MAKEKMAVKFEKPPVHVTNTGSLSIKVDDIFHSKVGQEVILRMATIAPTTAKKAETDAAMIVPQPAKEQKPD